MDGIPTTIVLYICKLFSRWLGHQTLKDLNWGKFLQLQIFLFKLQLSFSVKRYHFAFDQFDNTQCSGDLFNRKPTFGSKTMCAHRPRPIWQHILATPIKISLAVTVWREQVQLNRIPVLPSTPPIAKMRRFTNRKIFSWRHKKFQGN